MTEQEKELDQNIQNEALPQAECETEPEHVPEESVGGEPKESAAQPEPEKNSWENIGCQAAKFQKRLQEISSLITQKEEVVDSLQSNLKIAKSELKEYQKQLLKLAKGGISEQLELDLPDAEPPVVEAENPSDDWKKLPILELDLPEKIKEKLAEHFGNCGEVCDWIGSDYVNKIKGLGESAREKIRDAIDKMAGVTEDAIRKEAAKKSTEETATEKDTLLTMPDDENSVERDPEKVKRFLSQVESMILEDCYFYANDTLEGIYDWVDENKVYTQAQESAVENIRKAPATEAEE